MSRYASLILWALLVMLCFVPREGFTMTKSCVVSHLRCEYYENPLGVDVAHPRLSWEMESSHRSMVQTAYRILVASSPSLLARDKGNLWDSGEVVSNKSLQIPYEGKRLRSYQRVFWKVRVWDEHRRPSDWSSIASWTMGVVKAKDWKAHWITAQTLQQNDYPNHVNGPGRYETLLLRHNFQVRKGLRRAIVTICGLGQYEMTLNGRKVGNDLLTPGWSKYDKTCLYDTYDITSLLRKGGNAVGVFLGNGMYDVHSGRYTKFLGSFGPLKAICQIMLEYSNGAKELVGTGPQWRATSGPITFSSIYGGEDYDARLTPSGWNKPGFDDANWDHCQITQGPGGELKGLSCSAPPIRPYQTLKPVHVQMISPTVKVYDLGRNASIMPKIKVIGPWGSSVTIIPAELINADGTVDRSSCGGGMAYWKFTLRGGKAESWFPKFFYQGCRYLQVELASPNGELPKLLKLEGVVIHSSSPAAGEFACSNKLFNRIYTIIRWAQRNNMMSILTDCPHRERLGWLEQDHLNGPSLRYDFNLDALYTKIMNDMADSQLSNGLIPDIAPEYVVFSDGFRDSPEWGSAFILCAWQQYEWADDTRILREYYDDMARYVAYLGSKANDHILSYGLSDWLDRSGDTPMGLTATAFYFDDLQVMEKIARVLGKQEDAANYANLKEKVRAAFNRAFFDPETHSYRNGGQTSNAIPLAMGIVEPQYRNEVLNAIVKDIVDRHYAITSGDVGYRYLLLALAQGGRSDVIYKLNNQTSTPGYGYQIAHGVTSLAESWDANRNDSQDHFMLGQIVEWFFDDLAGIGYDRSSPAFSKIIIKPTFTKGLKWVRAYYDSPHGRISSSWKIQKNHISLDISIPANTTAVVYLPSLRLSDITESGKPIRHAVGVNYLKTEGKSMEFSIGSGEYRFNIAK